MKIPFLSRLLEIKEEQLKIEFFKIDYIEATNRQLKTIIEQLDILTKLNGRKSGK